MNICCKCGGMEIGVKYIQADPSVYNFKYKKTQTECLEKTCKRCGYTWEDPTLDHKDENDEKFNTLLGQESRNDLLLEMCSKNKIVPNF